MRGQNALTIAILCAGTLCAEAIAQAQGKPSAAIPSTAPTSSVSDLPSARPVVSDAARSGNRVSWDGAVLTIDAGGDSLRNILRQVARATTMKVTGGVPDEQVFGSYGPGSVQTVMGSLFNGLNVNMVLINSSPTIPKELVLTARTGGPTPPSPSQPLNLLDDMPSAAQAQPAHPGPHTSPRSFGPVTPQDPPAGTQPAGGADPGAAAGAAVDTDGQPPSPNGVRTPEQIFQELRRRQQPPQ